MIAATVQQHHEHQQTPCLNYETLMSEGKAFGCDKDKSKKNKLGSQRTIYCRDCSDASFCMKMVGGELN
jgi:hypothetical protein